MSDGKGATWAILIGVWATFALDVYSSLNSSPQTTEINAQARASTLMKWVLIGDAVAVGGGLAGSAVSGSWLPLAAAGGVAVGMHLLYAHAKKSGLEKPGKPTEDYSYAY
jgi:hypothetical protein